MSEQEIKGFSGGQEKESTQRQAPIESFVAEQTPPEETPSPDEVFEYNSNPFHLPTEKKADAIELLGGVSFEQKRKNVWMVTLEQDIVKECNDLDKKWIDGKFGFGQNIASDFPYVMAPETSEIVFAKAENLGEMMKSFGIDIKPWDVKGDDTPYTLKLLHRDKVPDTFKPIFWNTDRIAEHLSQIETKKDMPLMVRSIGTGSGVAEKCLLARLYDEYGITDMNLISTDLAETSIAAAAVNISLWNETLPESEKYRVYVVNGEIPADMYKLNRVVILQIADAKDAMAWEKNKGIGYDALSLDNVLPYLSHELNDKILESVISNKGDSGLYLTSLGLDQGIKVSLDKAFQYKEILNPFKNLMKGYMKAYEKNGSLPIHNGYWHTYGFHIRNDKSFLIDRVLSEGSAKMFTWIRKLIYHGQFETMGKVTASINKATSLSSAKEEVQSPPFESYIRYLKILQEEGLLVDAIEAPLYPEKFGYQLVDSKDFVYKKDEKTYTYQEVMEECRTKDPVVLRGSSLYIR